MGLTGGAACESCGRPMMSERDHGGGRGDNPYCRHCTDARGSLRAYEDVLEGLVRDEFMARNGMARPQAEVAARNALRHSPAWKGRG
ncbi:MAG: zinc ribbon domain-containing protein [Polyangiales bacterium]